MTSCNFCGRAIGEKTVICARCAQKSHDPFYQNLEIYPYGHPVDVWEKGDIMIPCSECGAWFFTVQGRREHTGVCIGYNPTPDSVSLDFEFMTALDMREP